jgi:hypothetical protein
MRLLDKKYRKALILFDKETKTKLARLKGEELQKYRKYVDEDIEKDLFELGYIDPDPNNNRSYALTPKGQSELRVLDGLVYNKYAIYISLMAIIIAILSVVVQVIKGR